jgi:hypothetical protein
MRIGLRLECQGASRAAFPGGPAGGPAARENRVSLVFVYVHRPPDPLPDPVRLIAPDRPGPFVPGRETVLAKVAGHGLAGLEIHDGDHVVLVRRDTAEHGDLAAVLDERGHATLWKVYPERDAMRLSTGRPGADRRVRPAPRIQGVVVAVLRRDAPPGVAAGPVSPRGG